MVGLFDSTHLDALVEKTEELLDLIAERTEDCMTKFYNSKSFRRVYRTAEHIGDRMSSCAESIVDKIIK